MQGPPCLCFILDATMFLHQGGHCGCMGVQTSGYTLSSTTQLTLYDLNTLAKPLSQTSHSSTSETGEDPLVGGSLSMCPLAHVAMLVYQACVLVMWTSLHPLVGEGLHESTTKGMAIFAWLIAMQIEL